MPFLGERSEEKRQVQTRKTKVTQITNQHLWKPKVSNLGDGLQLQETPLVPLLPAKNRNTRLQLTQTHHKQKIGKTCPGLMRLSVVVLTTWRHGSILPRISASGCCWWCNGGTFLAHFGPLSTNWRSFKRCSLPESYCWPHRNHLASSNALCPKAQITSTAVWNRTMSSLCEMERVVLSPERWAQPYRVPVKNGFNE